MRTRILVTAFLVFAFAGASTLLARGIAAACVTSCCGSDVGCCAGSDGCGGGCAQAGTCKDGRCDGGNCAMACCEGMAQHQTASASLARDKQWAIVNFVNAVRVGKAYVSGPVLIVHDDARMARGEPCTTFYRFIPGSGPREELLSFHCKPRRAVPTETTTFASVTLDAGVKQLTEYQMAGDAEAHGIPR